MLDSAGTQRYEAPVLVEPRLTFLPRHVSHGGNEGWGAPFFWFAWPVQKTASSPPSDLPMHARRPAHSPLASARRSSRRDGGRVLSAGVAQLAEHLFCKQVVGGSSPPASSTLFST